MITGVFQKFECDKLKETIEINGGKVFRLSSSKTSYLIAGSDCGPAKLEKQRNLKSILSQKTIFKNASMKIGKAIKQKACELFILP